MPILKLKRFIIIKYNKALLLLFTIALLSGCSPKGPQTYTSPYLGKHKEELIITKGLAKEIRVFGNTEAYIYKTREEYFGKIKGDIIPDSLIPKNIFSIEYIYYINENNIIYKYQVWKKRIK